MGYTDTIVGRILHSHLMEGTLEPGSEIGIKIDQTLTQDATGTLVNLQFMSLGIERVRTNVSVSYVDHNTLQSSYENADDHLFLQTAAAKLGVYFSRPGNGICHQVHLERFGIPGQTLLGSDSHTPTAGGIGMLAVGAGGLDVALAMAGAPFYMVVPKVICIRLTGTLEPWVTAKDVILYLLGKFTVKGGLGKIIEYGGPAIKNLSVPERATITNMGAELGIWTSIFPSDEVTRQFLSAQGRDSLWTQVCAGKNARYEDVIEIDLSSLEPMAACPHSPDSIKTISELSGMKVDQVAIGSCTNSSFRDLKMVAELLKGRKVNENVSLVISPGSRQVLSMLARDGSLCDIIDSGARILELACGPCIGMGQAPPSRGVSVRTFNRNFESRCGTPDAGVYLVSPPVAAAAAVTGSFVHPATLGDEPEIVNPEKFFIDDSMILSPSDNPEDITIRMGPNIKPLPELGALPGSLNLKLVLKLDDNITTDDILPGGAKVLPLRSNLPAISEYVFSLIRPDFSKLAKAAGLSAILGRENYGQGSSREHAALAPRYLGVRAVLAISIARLHRANLINFGILPVLIDEEAYKIIEEGDDLDFADIFNSVAFKEKIKIKILNKNLELSGMLDLSMQERDIVKAGGRLNYFREKL